MGLRVSELPIPGAVKEILEKEGIVELYPPQEEAIRVGALEGRNLVLASPTASGKTLIAELCAMRHVLELGGRVVYLTPLRALAYEKYVEFRKYEGLRKPGGGRVRVAISTGDYDSPAQHLANYDIIVLTNEKADSLLRHRAHWMGEISLVVADEVHLLTDAGRGPTLEVVLARLMQVNPKLQILALSATIKNADEIAGWLEAGVVSTDWRPVELREGVLLHDEVQFKDGGAVKIGSAGSTPVTSLVRHTVRLGGQALVFTGTRQKAVSMAKKLAVDIRELISKPLERSLERVAEEVLAAGERTRISELLAELVRCGVAFHHAGLAGHHRRIIEDAFRDGKLKAVTATPTLAFGVNLPARTVVIRDYQRYEPGYGYYPISVLEYKQMAGRAGRPKYDPVGEAILVARTEDERDYLMESYVLAEPERIWSKLAVESALRSHVLATVASGFAYTERGVYEFFDRTFYAYQYGGRMIKGAIAKVLNLLASEGLIEVDGERVYATPFGRRVSELYIDPVSAVIIRDALANRPPLLTDLSFLQLVAHTPDIYPKTRPYRRELRELELSLDAHREEFMTPIPDPWEDSVAYEEFLGELKTALVLNAWINETPEDDIIGRYNVQPGDLYRLVDSAKWLLYATHELAELFGHRDLLQRLSTLMERVEKGVKPELLPLTRLRGIGRVRARALYNAGYTTIEELKRAKMEELMAVPHVGPKVAKAIKEQVGGLIKKRELERLKREEWQQKTITEY